MKIVINKCFGGFGLSDAVYLRLIALGIPTCPIDDSDHGQAIGDSEHPQSLPSARNLSKLTGTRYHASWLREDANRTHPLLVQAVEEVGSAAASGKFAKLSVVEIPDGVDYEIDEYDGRENVRERSRSWG